MTTIPPKPGREWRLAILITIGVLVLLVILAAVFKSPFSRVSFADLKHNPFLLNHPAPVKIEVRTRPERMQVRFLLGWESLHRTKRRTFYRADVSGEAEGVTPLTLRVLDKGYSYVRFEFQRGENRFTKTYPSVPTVIDLDFSHRMVYPRLEPLPPEGTPAAAPANPSSPQSKSGAMP